MSSEAKVSSVRIATRKVALLADQIRGKGINEALGYLNLSPRKACAKVLRDLLKSAAANAAHRGTVDVDQLFVKTILVGQGPTYKRFLTRAKGSASPILKRTSHVHVTLAEKK